MALLSLNHRFYYSKMTIWIQIIMVLAYIAGLVTASDLFSGYPSMDMSRLENAQEYMTEVMVLTKIFLVMNATYLGITFNLESYNNLAKYVVDSSGKRLGFVYGKLIYQILNSFIQILVYFLILAVYTSIFTPFEVVSEANLRIFYYIFLEVLTLILMIDFLMMIFRNLFMGFLPFAIFWYMEINNHLEVIKNSEWLSTLYRIIPNLIRDEESFILYQGVELYLCIQVILILGCGFLSLARDVK